MSYVPQFMDRVIDRTYYPVSEARAYNTTMRSIGIGIQGLADTLQLMDVPYGSGEGTRWCRDISEAIQYCALECSMFIAKERGPYDEFKGSPYSKGLLHHNLWCLAMKRDVSEIESGRYDWKALRDNIMKYGVRNSNVTAYMPTASSSIIGGYNECFYGNYPANTYTKKTNAGNLMVVNRVMFERLQKEGFYTPDVLTKIFQRRGSLKGVVPDVLTDLFLTIYEQGGRWMVRNTAAMQPFVCQGISMSAHLRFDKSLSAEERMKKAEADYQTFLLYARKQGLVTLSYYPRSETFARHNDFGTATTSFIEEEEEEEEEDRGPCSSGACEA